ncbi:MAG: hypothetical protein RML45_00890 [Acetobacteraceae bacterium]|nr:hypothetical protein [Acetobacteraceae bacterium]
MTAKPLGPWRAGVGAAETVESTNAADDGEEARADGAGPARRMAGASASSLDRRRALRGIGLTCTLPIRLLSRKDFGRVAAAALLHARQQTL